MKTFKTVAVIVFGMVLLFLLLVFMVIVVVGDPDSYGKSSTDSMYPTMQKGALYFSDKGAYKTQSPLRGDIVVFKYKELQESLGKSPNSRFNKRVVGLPGETITIKGGKVFINDKLLEEPYLDKNIFTYPGDFLSEGKKVKIPPGQYAVLGDKRSDSLDSRSWGFLRKENITAKVTGCLVGCSITKN